MKLSHQLALLIGGALCLNMALGAGIVLWQHRDFRSALIDEQLNRGLMPSGFGEVPGRPPWQGSPPRGPRQNPVTGAPRAPANLEPVEVGDLPAPERWLLERLRERGRIAGSVYRSTGSADELWSAGTGDTPWVRIQRRWRPPAPSRAPLLIYLLGSAVIVLICTTLYATYLGRPVRRLHDNIRRIESGNPPHEDLAEQGPSELRQLDRSLLKMSQQIRDSGRERELMLAGLSHDIRSPLMRIRLHLAPLPVPADAAEQMDADIETIDHILGQFVHYARDGRDEPLQPCSVSALLTQITATSGLPDLTVSIQDCPPVSLRPLAVSRAVRNLLDNAVRYGKPPFQLTARLDGEQLRVAIEDSGHGLTTTQWNELLRPFARADMARSHTGSGLGLAIAERVAIQHQGSLSAEQTPTGFRVLLSLRAHKHL